MATYLFKIEWERVSYKEVHGWLYSRESGIRLSILTPEYVLRLSRGKEKSRLTPSCPMGSCRHGEVLKYRHWHVFEDAGGRHGFLDEISAAFTLESAKRNAELHNDKHNWVR